MTVAVIDGRGPSHPDLKATGGTNCVSPARPPTDDNEHGTHVAGTIAARNKGSGVVGVAAGTRIFAVKVLDSSGSGTLSQVVCGIDWVTSTRSDSDPSNDISVANMSLGAGGGPIDTCPTTIEPEHQTICNSTAAGVNYVVAAGNSGMTFRPSAPFVSGRQYDARAGAGRAVPRATRSRRSGPGASRRW